MATPVPSTATANMSIHSTIRRDAREASRQNRRRACACATQHPRAPPVLSPHRPRLSVGARTSCAVGLTVADYCDLRPRMPSGSASPTRWPNIALPRSRLASMRAAASAYGTIIWGIRDAKTGRNSGPGKARANAGRPERAARRARCAAGPGRSRTRRPSDRDSAVASPGASGSVARS
jgi:hypothetical protein